jgi:uncharacterized membrane-anchored protein YhcB (DUF1043 family)
MMAVIKRLGVLSWAKIEMLMMAVAGFVIGLLLGITLLFFPPAQVPAAELASAGAEVIFVAPFIYAILGLVLGFIIGLIRASLYNLFAKWVGGIEVQIEVHKKIDPIAPRRPRN